MGSIGAAEAAGAIAAIKLMTLKSKISRMKWLSDGSSLPLVGEPAKDASIKSSRSTISSALRPSLVPAVCPGFL
jgi:hypothetical protein